MKISGIIFRTSFTLSHVGTGAAKFSHPTHLKCYSFHLVCTVAFHPLQTCENVLPLKFDLVADQDSSIELKGEPEERRVCIISEEKGGVPGMFVGAQMSTFPRLLPLIISSSPFLITDRDNILHIATFP